MKIQLYLILGTFILIGCSQSDKVYSLADSYLLALKENRYSDSYEMLSQSDKDFFTIDEYKDYLMGTGFTNSRIPSEKKSYEIKNVIQNEESYMVESTITSLSLEDLIGQLFIKSLESSFTEKSDNEIESLTEDAINDGEFNTTTENKNFKIIKEGKDWQVLEDFKFLFQLDSMLNSVTNAINEKEFEKANSNLEKLIEFAPQNENVKEISSTFQEMYDKFLVRKVYIDSMDLYDVKAKYYESYFDDRSPGVTFKIKNKGKRTIYSVKVKFTFLDESNTEIFEKEIVPILVSDNSFYDSDPLKPNYIWQNERGTYYSIDDVPDEWKEGNIKAEIVDISFEKIL